ncbi:hypothetical protein RJ641_022546 [Dillenia turbinata]|uniref:Uncharacterized protein n=1 Tax=Dillenia turbinata TaxID=194707 RepID=A0AAN8YUG4_9MAGN
MARLDFSLLFIIIFTLTFIIIVFFFFWIRIFQFTPLIVSRAPKRAAKAAVVAAKRKTVSRESLDSKEEQDSIAAIENSTSREKPSSSLRLRSTRNGVAAELWISSAPGKPRTSDLPRKLLKVSNGCPQYLNLRAWVWDGLGVASLGSWPGL